MPDLRTGGFFEAEWFIPESQGRRVFAKLPVYRQRLAELQQQYPVIRESEWMERDGHIQMEVPLDAGLPVEFLKALIDESYALIWNKLDAKARLKIEMAGEAWDEAKLLHRLIEMHGLTEQRDVILRIARPGILLRTRSSWEIRIPLGATKIGGRPDLPPEVEWPKYRDGRPLAFLAQLNLAEIAKVELPAPKLPPEGLLSVFSVWGWVNSDDCDPLTPIDGGDEQIGWTVAIYSPLAKLRRRKTPHGANSYKAAAVEPIRFISLPIHCVEREFTSVNWNDDQQDRFRKLQADFRSLQMRHWLNSSDIFTSHHLLGGYPLFQQQFPDELLSTDLVMFLQIGTDRHTGMLWSDGGELTFYAEPKSLANGISGRIWGTCQGG